MKNHSTIWATLALGTVLGAAGASLVPHATAAPTVTTPYQTVDGRLDVLESKVNALQTQVSVLLARAPQATGSGNLGVNVLPYQPPALPPSAPSNIPPHQIILLKTPGK